MPCNENSSSSAVSATVQAQSACLEGPYTSIHDSRGSHGSTMEHKYWLATTSSTEMVKASLLCSGVLSVSDLASPICVPTQSSYSFVAKSGVGSQESVE